MMNQTKQNVSDTTDIEHDDNFEFDGATLKLEGDTIQDLNENKSTLSSSNNNNNKIVNNFSATIQTTSKELNQNTTMQQQSQQQQTINSQSLDSNNSNQLVNKPKIGSPRHFFSFRSGQFEQAIHDCLNIILRPINDIDIKGNWLLTEISHWDHERERIVILTSKTLYILKYDFIAMRILENNKFRLNIFDTIVKGKLVYPNSSVVPNRHDVGIRLLWNKGQPISTVQSWNPFASNIPWKTFTNHPLFGYNDEYNSPPQIKENLIKNQKNYSIETFYDELQKLFQNEQIDDANVNYNCAFQEKEIVLENYVGIGALIHNKNNFGFFKVRGKFSF